MRLAGVRQIDEKPIELAKKTVKARVDNGTRESQLKRGQRMNTQLESIVDGIDGCDFVESREGGKCLYPTKRQSRNYTGNIRVIYADGSQFIVSNAYVEC